MPSPRSYTTSFRPATSAPDATSAASRSPAARRILRLAGLPKLPPASTSGVPARSCVPPRVNTARVNTAGCSTSRTTMLTPPKSTATPFRRTVTTLLPLRGSRSNTTGQSVVRPAASSCRTHSTSSASPYAYGARQHSPSIVVRWRRRRGRRVQRRRGRRRGGSARERGEGFRRSPPCSRRSAPLRSRVARARSCAARRARGRRSSRRSHSENPPPSTRPMAHRPQERRWTAPPIVPDTQYHGMVRVKWSRAPSHGSSRAPSHDRPATR